MATIARHKKTFLSNVGDYRVLFRHCLKPRAPHSDAGVEAAFLQMFKAWEVFLEEVTMSFLCGRLRCDGAEVRSHTVSDSEDWARKALMGGKDFLDWAKFDVVEARWRSLFYDPSCLVGLGAGKAELKHMVIVRNYIAHASRQARKKFDDIVQGNFGGARRLHRAADYLASRWPEDESMTMFDVYANVLETLCRGIAGK